MKVALYCRVSTDNFNQDVSRQINELNEISDRQGWDVVETYVDDGVSGTKKSRPALNQMLKDARQRKFKMIVCLELSRLARSTKHLLDMLEDLKKRDIHLYVHNQGIDTSNYMGEFLMTILSAIAQMEVSQLKERVKSGIKNSRKKGDGSWGRKSNLTPEKERQIRLKRNEGWGIIRLAKEFKVGQPTIRKVIAA